MYFGTINFAEEFETLTPAKGLQIRKLMENGVPRNHMNTFIAIENGSDKRTDGQRNN